MKKKKAKDAPQGEENPIRALGLHIAGLRAGIMDHKPQPDSPAHRVADLLAEAAYILLTPPNKNGTEQK
jgi:hypothetical protein